MIEERSLRVLRPVQEFLLAPLRPAGWNNSERSNYYKNSESPFNISPCTGDAPIITTVEDDLINVLHCGDKVYVSGVWRRRVFADLSSVYYNSSCEVNLPLASGTGGVLSTTGWLQSYNVKRLPVLSYPLYHRLRWNSHPDYLHQSVNTKSNSYFSKKILKVSPSENITDIKVGIINSESRSAQISGEKKLSDLSFSYSSLSSLSDECVLIMKRLLFLSRPLGACRQTEKGLYSHLQVGVLLSLVNSVSQSAFVSCPQKELKSEIIYSVKGNESLQTDSKESVSSSFSTSLEKIYDDEVLDSATVLPTSNQLNILCIGDGGGVVRRILEKVSSSLLGCVPYQSPVQSQLLSSSTSSSTCSSSNNNMSSSNFYSNSNFGSSSSSSLYCSHHVGPTPSTIGTHNHPLTLSRSLGLGSISCSCLAIASGAVLFVPFANLLRKNEINDLYGYMQGRIKPSPSSAQLPLGAGGEILLDDTEDDDTNYENIPKNTEHVTNLDKHNDSISSSLGELSKEEDEISTNNESTPCLISLSGAFSQKSISLLRKTRDCSCAVWAIAERDRAKQKSIPLDKKLDRNNEFGLLNCSMNDMNTETCTSSNSFNISCASDQPTLASAFLNLPSFFLDRFDLVFNFPSNHTAGGQDVKEENDVVEAETTIENMSKTNDFQDDKSNNDDSVGFFDNELEEEGEEDRKKSNESNDISKLHLIVEPSSEEILAYLTYICSVKPTESASNLNFRPLPPRNIPFTKEAESFLQTYFHSRRLNSSDPVFLFSESYGKPLPISTISSCNTSLSSAESNEFSCLSQATSSFSDINNYIDNKDDSKFLKNSTTLCCPQLCTPLVQDINFLDSSLSRMEAKTPTFSSALSSTPVLSGTKRVSAHTLHTLIALSTTIARLSYSSSSLFYLKGFNSSSSEAPVVSLPHVLIACVICEESSIARVTTKGGPRGAFPSLHTLRQMSSDGDWIKHSFRECLDYKSDSFSFESSSQTSIPWEASLREYVEYLYHYVSGYSDNVSRRNKTEYSNKENELNIHIKNENGINEVNKSIWKSHNSSESDGWIKNNISKNDSVNNRIEKNILFDEYLNDSRQFSTPTPFKNYYNSKKINRGEPIVTSSFLSAANAPFNTPCLTFSSENIQNQKKPLLLNQDKLFNEEEDRQNGVLSESHKLNSTSLKTDYINYENDSYRSPQLSNTQTSKVFLENDNYLTSRQLFDSSNVIEDNSLQSSNQNIVGLCDENGCDILSKKDFSSDTSSCIVNRPQLDQAKLHSKSKKSFSSPNFPSNDDFIHSKVAPKISSSDSAFNASARALELLAEEEDIFNCNIEEDFEKNNLKQKQNSLKIPSLSASGENDNTKLIKSEQSYNEDIFDSFEVQHPNYNLISKKSSFDDKKLLSSLSPNHQTLDQSKKNKEFFDLMNCFHEDINHNEENLINLYSDSESKNDDKLHSDENKKCEQKKNELNSNDLFNSFSSSILEP